MDRYILLVALNLPVLVTGLASTVATFKMKR